MKNNDVILKYNYVIDKFRELLYTSLLKAFSKEELEPMNLTNYIFEAEKLYPKEAKAFGLLRYLYIDSSDDLYIKIYDLMNLYDYMKGVIIDEK